MQGKITRRICRLGFQPEADPPAAEIFFYNNIWKNLRE
jgi:hypothetical protein